MIITKATMDKKEITFWGRDEALKRRSVKIPRGRETVFWVKTDKKTDLQDIYGNYLEVGDGFPQFYDETFEADVSEPLKYRLTRGIKYSYDFEAQKVTDENHKLRILILDIETDDKNGLSALDVENASEQIKCLTIYDNYKNIYYILGTNSVDVMELANRIGHLRFKIEIFSSEFDMLQWFKNYLNSEDEPDILSGYNSIGYDIPYLKKRSQNIGVYLNFDRFIIFDLEIAYITYTVHRRPGYTLEETVEHELNEHKVQRESIWKMKPIDLYYYNYYDVYLLVKLEEKLDLFGYMNIINRTTGSGLDGVYYPTYYVDTIMLFYAHAHNLRLPSKKDDKDVQRGYIGAVVFSAIEGIFDNVIVFDASASYPSTILNYNISPETLLPDGTFDTTKIGILPSVIKLILEERYRVRGLMDKATGQERKDLFVRQYGLKTVSNIFYGVFANPKFRLCSIPVASSIVELAKQGLKIAGDHAIERNFIRLYGDTDSVFFTSESFKNLSKEEILRVALDLQKEFNNIFDEMMKPRKNYFSLKIEEIYSKWIQVGTKKRYAGLKIYDGKWLDEPELDVKGFEVVRKDRSIYTKKTQKNLIDKLLRYGKKQAKEFYDAEKNRWAKKEVPLEEIALSFNPNKDIEDYKSNLPIVKALKNSQKLGINIDKQSNRFWIYYCKDIGEVAINKDDRLPAQLKIDWDVHYQKCFVAPLKRFEPYVTTQDNLDKWFKKV